MVSVEAKRYVLLLPVAVGLFLVLTTYTEMASGLGIAVSLILGIIVPEILLRRMEYGTET